MKLKGIKLKGTYKITYYKTDFVVRDEKGKVIYVEDGDGFWFKKEYDKRGNETYYEESSGCWFKSEYDEKGNEIHSESSDGSWKKWEYNKQGKVIYYEQSNGYWSKIEYDKEGNEIYFEDSNSKIIDKRVKELTIEQIEKLLGYKIKIKGNESVNKNMNVEQEGADFYGATKCSEKADDILFALQVIFGQPKYTYRDFQKMNLSQTEINEALKYVEKKGYNKFSYFG